MPAWPNKLGETIPCKGELLALPDWVARSVKLPELSGLWPSFVSGSWLQAAACAHTQTHTCKRWQQHGIRVCFPDIYSWQSVAPVLLLPLWFWPCPIPDSSNCFLYICPSKMLKSFFFIWRQRSCHFLKYPIFCHFHICQFCIILLTPLSFLFIPLSFFSSISFQHALWFCNIYFSLWTNIYIYILNQHFPSSIVISLCQNSGSSCFEIPHIHLCKLLYKPPCSHSCPSLSDLGSCLRPLHPPTKHLYFWFGPASLVLPGVDNCKRQGLVYLPALTDILALLTADWLDTYHPGNQKMPDQGVLAPISVLQYIHTMHSKGIKFQC